MKKLVIALGVVVVTALLVSTVSAALPGPGWWTSFQVQNVGEEEATLAYTAYWQVGLGGTAGDDTYSEMGTVTMGAGSALIYNPGVADPDLANGQLSFNTSDEHLPTGFAGGVQVSADQPIVAVVQVGNNPAGSVGTTGGRAIAFYQGTGGESAGDMINFPSMKHNYYGQTTAFYIQAAGGDANVDATFHTSVCPGNTSQEDKDFPLTDIDIPMGKTYLLDPSAAGVPETGSGCLGSLTVEANSGSIAGVVIETQHAANPGTFALATKGFAVTDADTTVVAPTNKTAFYGGRTGWQLLNTDDSLTASVAVTFTVTNIEPGSAADTAGAEVGDQYRADIEIAPGGSYLFSEPNGNYYEATPLDGAPAMGEGLFFAGTAVSDVPLVGVVNENNGPNRLVYSSFGGNAATTKVAAPLVKEYWYGGLTGLAVQNVGDDTATVNLAYDCKDAAGGRHLYDVGPYDIEVGAAMSFIRLSDATRWGEVLVASSSQCAVTVTSDGEPIVALAQESSTFDTRNYEGFSLAP
jgi:hypothetical protein